MELQGGEVIPGLLVDSGIQLAAGSSWASGSSRPRNHVLALSGPERESERVDAVPLSISLPICHSVWMDGCSFKLGIDLHSRSTYGSRINGYLLPFLSTYGSSLRTEPERSYPFFSFIDDGYAEPKTCQSVFPCRHSAHYRYKFSGACHTATQ